MVVAGENAMILSLYETYGCSLLRRELYLVKLPKMRKPAVV